MEEAAKTVHGDIFHIGDGLDGDVVIEIDDKCEDTTNCYYLNRTEALALAAAIKKHFEGGE